MVLKELMYAVDYKEIVNRTGIDTGSTQVLALCSDSRKASINSVFVCIRGAHNDGHDHADAAYLEGCRIFVTECKIDLPDDAFIIIVNDTRIALAELSACFFGYPSRSLTVIGVTGTKGKTTSSLLIYNILNESGIPTGYIGSNGIDYMEQHFSSLNTTPESYEIQAHMRRMLDFGVQILVMEVSSQALKMARVHGIRFDICVFTNLAPDHIGEFEHPDFEDYKKCKRSLFTDYGAEYIVYNGDDEYAHDVVGGSKAEKASVCVGKDANFRADGITYFRSAGNIGVSFECTFGGKAFPVALSFPGEFSVYNALTAIAVCTRLGLSPGRITKAMRHIRIKGRFETHELPCGATVVIDYAHNGVSLKAALAALRAYEPTRLICLFGSVGGRTRMRRAELGLVASRDADFCILTSDNPGDESPSAIISEIASYFTAGTCPYVAIPDRREAIDYALKNAKEGDIILLAGKGHESYQLVCGERYSFSETEIVEKYCKDIRREQMLKTKIPLKLSYTAKTALWAGKRLKSEFGKQSKYDTVSETWELSVREDEMATIVGGDADGSTLAEYFEAAGYSVVSPDFKKGDRFPLLVKLIDANDMLSVQVHPDDAFAGTVENDSGKTEMWYIVDAKAGAKLVYGLKDGVSREDFAKAVEAGRIDEVMNYCPVKAGETYFIPAGMLHAIGAGILVAEIQQNSDLTYRVYDFDRIGPDGKLRQLHVDKALRVTRPYSNLEIDSIRYSCGKSCREGELLANCEYFTATRIEVKGTVDLRAEARSFLSILCIEGEGSISHDGKEYALAKGDSYFIPAGMGDFSINGNALIIVSSI